MPADPVRPVPSDEPVEFVGRRRRPGESVFGYAFAAAAVGQFLGSLWSGVLVWRPGVPDLVLFLFDPPAVILWGALGAVLFSVVFLATGRRRRGLVAGLLTGTIGVPVVVIGWLALMMHGG